MKLGGKREICVLIGVLLSVGAKAATSEGADKPYGAIVERNVFNLHAPPPPVNPADLIKKQPPPKITLTGITTILGKKVTFLTTPATKPGAAPESAMLAEGQAMNDIEVKSIDEKAGVVQVINHGDPQTLDFEHDGAKPSGAPPGGPAPNPMMPAPAAAPANIAPIPPPNNVVRPLRSLTRGSPLSENGGGFGGGFNNGSMNGNQNAAPLSREEQVALIEIQRIKAQQENNPIGRILPPTEMTPEVMGTPPATQ